MGSDGLSVAAPGLPAHAHAHAHAHRYEFGVVNAAGMRVPRSSGSGSSVTLTALGVGTVPLYVCAFDSERSSACSETNVTITAPAADFDASAALVAVDMYALSQVGGWVGDHHPR